MARFRIIRVRGPRGPEGGTGSNGYTHVQSVAATTWTINHLLGFKPDIALFTVGGNVFEADISHPSNIQSIVTLVVARAGSARCT